MDTGDADDFVFYLGESGSTPMIYAANTESAELEYHTTRGSGGVFSFPAYNPLKSSTNRNPGFRDEGE